MRPTVPAPGGPQAAEERDLGAELEAIEARLLARRWRAVTLLTESEYRQAIAEQEIRLAQARGLV